MNVTRFLLLLLVLAWGVLGPGTGLALSATQSTQAASSQTSSKTVTGSLPHGNDDNQSRRKDETREQRAAEDPYIPLRVKKDITNHRTVQGRARWAMSPVARLPNHPPQTNARRTTAVNPNPTSSGTSDGVTNRTVIHGTVPARTGTVAALGGEQFRNRRDPGARLASSGGPANSTRGAAVINGSDMRRKL